MSEYDWSGSLSRSSSGFEQVHREVYREVLEGVRCVFETFSLESGRQMTTAGKVAHGVKGNYARAIALISGLIVGAWTFVSAATVFGAEPDGKLTLDRAVASALEREGFDRVQSARLEVLEGERRSETAWTNPTLSIEREQHWEGGEAVAEDFFVLEQALPIWGARGLRAEMVRAQMEAVESANAAERLERRIAVERAFYETLRYRRRLELARELRDQIAATVEVMDKRVEADEASAYDVAQLEEELVEAKATVAEAQADLVVARGNVASLVGRAATPLERWSVRGELLPDELPEIGRLVAQLDEQPEIEELRAEARAEAKHREALGRSVVPVPALVGGYMRIDDPANGSLHGMVVGVSFDLPIFNRAGGEREAAAARRAKLEAQARLRRREAETQLRAAYEAAQLRMASARRYRDRAIPRAEEELKRARQRQESGVGSLSGLVEAHRGVYEAKSEAIEWAWQARDAVIEVKARAGGWP